MNWNKNLYLLLLFIVSLACNQAKENQLILNQEDNQVIKDWIVYYKSEDDKFRIEDFIFKGSDSLLRHEGTVNGIFDKEFDTLYTDFLVFNETKDKYIDFDSYNWVVNDENKIAFSVDQEIDLVDVAKKTVTRIGFNGSSQWVEEAFWKNDSTVVLLENNIENQPLIVTINLKRNTTTTFQYKDKLDFKSGYAKKRLEKKGLIIE